MIQDSFIFKQSPFEKATAEQLVSYKVARGDKETDKQLKARINKLVKSDKIQAEASALVNKWNSKRIKLGLKAWQ